MLLELNCKDKNVIDIGTGTGVLAILARILEAKMVIATDNDIWCYENTLENIQMNNLTNIEVNLSESLDTINQSFDIVIANIHKNYQLENMSKMKSLLNENGFILISGFYQEDAKEILNLCSSLGLVAHSVKIENNWCAICLTITD
jgi:ribosomal protein L11 methyltransferase